MLAYLDTIIAFAVVMLGFSLLITLFNQMVSTLLGMRGTNLFWGIESMLTMLDPKLKDHAQGIANKLLTNPVVSDSIFARIGGRLGQLVNRWKLANAIGPDAFVRGLRQIADDATTDPSVQTILKGLIDQVDPEANRKLELVTSAFTKLHPPPGFAVQVDDYLKSLSNTAKQSVGQLEAWFNVTMNRVSQRFTMKIRIVTIIAAFILAFGVHLDSFSLANQLLGNPDVRAQTVGLSQQMLDEAGAILGEPPAQPAAPSSEMSVSPKVLKASMEKLLKDKLNKANEAQPQKLDSVPDFKNIAEAEKWLSEGLKPDVSAERKQQLLGFYRQTVIEGLSQEATHVTNLLKQTGLELVPGDRKLSDLWHNPLAFFFAFDGFKNFLGILLTAGLLGLGAPFWYNTLKTLTSLRPVVATKQDQQRQQSA